jgi:K+-sensing histidine kinase KdpD
MASTLWRSAAQYFAGGIGLALVTFVCVRFGQDIHVAAFGYLILIVALALTSEFVGSVVLSIVAAGCLTYYFAPSLLSFRLDDLEAVATIAAFLTISLFVNGLIIQRKWTEAKLLKAQAELAHVTRVTTLGELSASIAHEVNQPLARPRNSRSGRSARRRGAHHREWQTGERGDPAPPCALAKDRFAEGAARRQQRH